MSAPRGTASACLVGNYLHGCDSSELISPRSLRAPGRLSPYAGNGGRYEKRLERWTHVRICECGYATPITTDAIARFALARHRCERYERVPVQLELPYDLPAAAASAVVHYLADRHNASNLDVDTAVVLRFAGGEHTLRLNPLERIAVYALMRRRGVDAKFCAEALRLSWSTQARYRRLVEAVA